MAPILATASGLQPALSARALAELLEQLRSLSFVSNETQLSDLVALLPSTWPFEEQSDLHEWIHTLNVIDSALDWVLKSYDVLLLPSLSQKLTTEDSTSPRPSLPDGIAQNVNLLLLFTHFLLRNATNKQLYASVDHVADLLAARDDTLAAASTQVLCSLATPPALHKQQAPEHAVHTTALHNIQKSNMTGNSVSETVLDRLVALSNRPSISSASGTATDDSADQIVFSYFVGTEEPELKEIIISSTDMVIDDAYTAENSDDTASKRRKVSDYPSVKSTAELWEMAVAQADGLAENERFTLLATTRRVSDATRLQALVACIYTDQVKQDAVACSELVDWLRPIVNRDSAASSSDMAHAVTIDEDYNVRMLATEALTALVSRRETGHRVSGVLTELGVGKGQYLGLLPTLIRYSLASLGTVLQQPVKPEPEDSAFEIGLAFVDASKGPTLQRIVQVERALSFIDNVLTLTSAVIGTPSGTSSLVDCGLIPALLNTVSMSPPVSCSLPMSLAESFSEDEARRVNALRRFVTAQAVQILEGALVTHNNALTAFHDLQGVQMLTTRLSREVELTRQQKAKEKDGDCEMTDASSSGLQRTIVSSQRVLLFSIVNCLTVAIQQEASTSTAAMPSGGVELRKEEVTNAIVAILDDVQSYGGHVASLISTLLSDILNADPHVVHYVHKCGLGDSFLDMVSGEKASDNEGTTQTEPILPPVPELLIAIPNVLAALALTENGAQAVAKRNPFPTLLKVLYHPNYVMPKSRCLLSELASIIGTGLDEIMRHVDNLRPLILSAVVDGMKNVVAMSRDLECREQSLFCDGEQIAMERNSIENERSCQIQYIVNFGQLLEQILNNEDHCEPFVVAGGLDALLQLYPASMPPCSQFLSYVSSLSTPSVSTLHHSTTEETLGASLRYIELRYNPLKMIRKLVCVANEYVDELDECKKHLGVGTTFATFSLDILPDTPLHMLANAENRLRLMTISQYLRKVANVQWITGVLASAIKGACQRSSETGSSWGRVDREWKQELSSTAFGQLVGRLSEFHSESLFEVCRARTHPTFEERERQQTSTRMTTLRYRLRIVCSEGAVVRDGIEIDSCASVGSMEMGDVVDAFDRCVNSSGILRYRTKRGWVSEMTRGHGREPIAEVFALWACKEEAASEFSVGTNTKTRIEAGLPDLRSVAVGVLARGQTSHSELFGALSKLIILGIRALPLPATFEEKDAGTHVSAIVRLVAQNIKTGFGQKDAVETAIGVLNGKEMNDRRITNAGASMYLGCMLSHLHSCIFDDKRERRMVNFPLLVLLLASDPYVNSYKRTKESTGHPHFGTFDAIRFVFKHALSDFAHRASVSPVPNEPDHQRVSRNVAASLPPLLAFLRKLVATPMSTSPAASIMSRMNWKDIYRLLSKDDLNLEFVGNPKEESFFHPESFLADLQFSLSRMAREVWCDERMLYTPPFLVHPIAKLVGEIVVVLEDVSKKKSSWSQSCQNVTTETAPDRMRLSDLMRRRQEDAMETDAVEGDGDTFQANEESVSTLMEMGFSRDRALHALESTHSNRVETAMDYALSTDPPSPGTLERRRIEREDQAQRRTENQAQHSSLAEGEDRVEGAMPREANAAAGSNESGTKEKDGSLDKVKNKASEPVKVSTRNTRAKTELEEWMTVAPAVACRLLDSMPCPSALRAKQTSGRLNSLSIHSDGDGESEALTVVLSSFLLELCHRFPEKRSESVSLIFKTLKSNLQTYMEIESAKKVDTMTIESQTEAGISALCHAAVLITRALPKTRLLVLKEGLVRALVTCIGSCIELQSADLTKYVSSMPMWLAPGLLLLDIMAQPIVAFSDEKMIGIITKDSPDSEFLQVEQEHKEQMSELFTMANRWMSCPSEEKAVSTVGAIPVAATNTAMETDDPSAKDKTKRDEPDCHFSLMPAYFPLLPLDLSQACLEICQVLLRMPSSILVSPGVAQSTLLLLLRLLRTPKVSSVCLQTGIAEAILALPKECKFTGSTGLVTLIFRRILEDGVTLQAAMETEIRGTVTKLYAKKNPSNKTESPQVALSSFIEAVTPLLCRDPSTFFKSMMLSVTLEAHDTKKGGTQVKLLSSPEKTRRTGLPAESGVLETNDVPEDKRDEKVAVPARAKSKSNKVSRRRSNSRKGRKSDQAKVFLTESPASHITSLLVNSIIISTNSGCSENEEEDRSFLWTGNQLEILADLALAVPACAAAIHNSRPHRYKDKSKRVSLGSQLSHALSNCPPPPKTFVTFLLHSVLPQDRWTIRNDPQIWSRQKDVKPDENAATKIKKKRASRVMKLSQNSARVLLALVVRPGEGRKRVISDLIFALSGGRLGHGATDISDVHVDNAETKSTELHALHAWGELSLGIAAPRSNGKNIDGLQSLGFENVRLLLENGMVHALLNAMHRVRLFHPMASSAYGSILLTLEVLTRANVYDAVKDVVQKEAQAQRIGAKSAHATTESENANLNSSRHAADVVFNSTSSTADSTNAIDVSNMDIHDDGTHDDGHDVAASDEDDEPSSEESEVDEDSDEGSDEMDEDDDSDDEDSEESSSDEVEGDGVWDVDYNNSQPVDGTDPSQDLEIDDEVTEQVDENTEDGWTRIESTGFGGMLLGERHRREGGNAPMLSNQNAPHGRSRGFIDAAEAMIGTLLRSGEISSDAVAEIEGQLGIHIMQGGRSLRASLRSGGPEDESTNVRVLGMENSRPTRGMTRGEVVGTLPHIQQRSQPEISYSAFGRSGQWVEVSSMEYVYGGPSVSGSSRNYDISSPISSDLDQDNEVSLTHLDLQLFPGGPSSAASARSQHSLHPLLCGVDLPPPNSLVSDILPHGARSTRRGQMTTRRPGDWTNNSMAGGGYLVSTSTGSLVRSNRTHTGATLGSGISSQNMTGPVGWTDDGSPVDATVQEFSSALERALDRTARATSDRTPLESLAPVENPAASVAAIDRVTETETTQGTVDEPDPPSENANRLETATSTLGTSRELEIGAPEQPLHQNHMEDDTIPTESDNGASSLVAGLRLSPGTGSSSPTPCGPELYNQSDANVTIETEREDLAEQAPAPPLVETSVSQPEIQAQESLIEGTVAAIPSERPRDDEVEENTAASQPATQWATNNNGLACPPDFDPEVFNSLPREMQQDCVNQFNATRDLAAQLDGSSLDPDVLAALPEDMRREVIEQERQERRMREEEQVPANPAHAEEMDNASFIASLAPDLRADILRNADEQFLSSLPPGIVAEARILQDRASSVRQRGLFDGGLGGGTVVREQARRPGTQGIQNTDSGVVALRRRQRSGKFKVELNRSEIVFLPESLLNPFSVADLKGFVRLLYLVSPIRPPRLLQRLFMNLCSNPEIRTAISSTLVSILHEDAVGALNSIEAFENTYSPADTWRRKTDAQFSRSTEFPPSMLLGVASEPSNPDVFNLSASTSLPNRPGPSAIVSANRCKLKDRSGSHVYDLPPGVSTRLVDTLLQLCKSQKFCLHTLVTPIFDGTSQTTCFEMLLQLLDKPTYAKNSTNLEHLLTMLESAVSPLSHLSKGNDQESEITQRDIDAAAALGKEYVDVPRVAVSQARLQLLCSILRMETCRDIAFAKVNTIVRRLCRVDMNRGYVLSELASVAHSLGVDAIRDLKALRFRMESAVAHHQQHLVQPMEPSKSQNEVDSPRPAAAGTLSSSVTLCTSTSELKLLRVLQTLQALCNDSVDETGGKKNEGSVVVTEELVHLLRQMHLDDLWDELSSCLRVVQVLEGVKSFEEEEKDLDDGENEEEEDRMEKPKKLRNSAAGLLTRFLPSIEAFFVANGSATRVLEATSTNGEANSPRAEDIALENLVGGKRMIEFATNNRVLLNALIRNNPGLLDKGLRALVQVPRCRGLLDFDVKRQWFKNQVRRLRQQANRRHGSLRLTIKREAVFEDAYHQLQPRNADEMRGRLHVTFRDEEGVDAGGLSREFFGILAKEIFNPNYALFTSTEDGCTFQPNPNSHINPDHLSYFRFVGRVVGKAVADGYLLDAHFTRSLYKHMLGLEPTHHDMEAIDPDYYRNLKTILEYNLADIGLDLTFSTEDHSFGRSQVINLIPEGRTIPVTDARKDEYVRLVCQHRMTTAIQSQIKSYLAGFYELVSPDLIAIFTPKELELLISGLPDIDVHDLKKNTDYQGWKATDKEIDWFWHILFSLSRNEKAAFLQFVTGSSKVPLSGFSELQGMRGIQKFSIHKAGGTKGALMSAHTCFNSLDLPAYSSEQEMREKLLYAINEGGGAFMFA